MSALAPSILCTKCRVPLNPPDSKFCSNCGHPSVGQMVPTPSGMLASPPSSSSPVATLMGVSLSQQQLDDMTWELSQSTQMAAVLGDVLANAARLKCVKKDIHFYTPPSAEQPVLFLSIKDADGNQSLVHRRTGFSVDELLSSLFLVVQPANVVYDESKVNKIFDVEVQFPDKGQSTVPKSIQFWSGGNYNICDGYSVYQCKYLNRTVSMTMKSPTPPPVMEKVKMEE